MAEQVHDNSAFVAASSNLPPGWDCKYDERAGRFYYLNYFTKTTTWEDPRLRYRPVAQPQQFFSSSSVHSSVAGESIPLQDLTNVRPSPIPSRAYSSSGPSPLMCNHGFIHSSSPTRASGAPASVCSSQDTSLNIETEQAVAKIGAMFPTVEENHVRALLKKYMKGLFPAAEETLLLDVLSNADNNVQKASEKLTSMGFEKRDSPPPRVLQKRKEEEQKALQEKQRMSATPTPPPRLKSSEEKQKMKKRLQDLYPDIPERVVTIALDSSDFDEERANHILQVMVDEEGSKPSSVDTPSSSKDGELHHEMKISTQKTDTPLLVESSPARSRKNSPARKIEKEKASIHKRAKGKREVPKVSRGTSTAEDKEYKSSYLQKTSGPNTENLSGANSDLLLVDYVTWQGPNTENRTGPRGIAKGPDKSLREGMVYTARGPNKGLCNGPVKGLAKGREIEFSHYVCG
ncbi:Hypothetical predicted protein [Cloeon dipterum]|uniref:WW domain-containing protein n=1 Tax=Cloeon dipterum TaxID=197152 RepID=A0A8S1D075_9INSE|nr:Hypothetical predicted protein [Cloeon dipterum]